MYNRLTEIQRQPVETVLSGIRSESAAESRGAAEALLTRASSYGVSLRDYLRLAIDPRLTEDEDLRASYCGAEMDGYEAALAHLGLPIRNDFANGVTLQAASETFQTFPGSRALFPEVIDDMVNWQYRQDLLETTAPMVANSRTINGNEVLYSVVPDEQEDYKRAAAEIAEGARIPVHSIRATDHNVKIWKHGMGYRTTYEFERRASLDILTPYANRAQREMEISKVAIATGMLLNGDAIHAAAPEVNQSDFDAKVNSVKGTDYKSGEINRRNLLAWLVSRAQAGTPVDTVVGNWDAYIQWLFFFSETRVGDRTEAEDLARSGFQMGGIPLLQGTVNFVVSSSMPDGKLLGYSRSDTMEELVEAGSLINESERSVSNQTISYYRTQNSGYRLVYGDTRSLYDFAEAA